MMNNWSINGFSSSDLCTTTPKNEREQSNTFIRASAIQVIDAIKLEYQSFMVEFLLQQDRKLLTSLGSVAVAPLDLSSPSTHLDSAMLSSSQQILLTRGGYSRPQESCVQQKAVSVCREREREREIVEHCQRAARQYRYVAVVGRAAGG
jgi:hypothetical protein